jgi:hypothetical protein
VVCKNSWWRKKETPEMPQSFLSICSSDSPAKNNYDFNPCDFEVVVPNSFKVHNVKRACYTRVEVPRLFPTVTETSNTLIWWYRKVVDLPIPSMPGYVLRTVDPNWSIWRKITIPYGIRNLDQTLAFINGIVGPSTPNEVWTYIPDTMEVTVTRLPWDPLVTFGVQLAGPPPPAGSNGGYLYLTSGNTTPGDTTSFDILGINAYLNAESRFAEAPLNPADPNTFDSTAGSNLANIVTWPMFRPGLPFNDTVLTGWISSGNVPPNFGGPTNVHVIVNNLGPTSMIRSIDGALYDVITTVSLRSTPLGETAVREVRDDSVEGICYPSPVDITGMRVRIVDHNFKTLLLPRNAVVSMVIQLSFDSE